MDGKQILTNIYEGIMDRGAVVATTPHEWTYDFMSWWEVFEHDGIELADIDVVSVYLREEGLLDGDKGVIYAIGEWLCDHAYKEYWTGLYTMKTCPECGATLFADMKVCYGCLHEFEEEDMATNVGKVERKNVVEVTDYPLKDDVHLANACTDFDHDGDYYAVYEDTSRREYDDGKWAVYQHASGELMCLVEDARAALNTVCGNEFGDRRIEHYKQIALDAGWPEVMRLGMTWRDVIRELESYGDAALDLPAYVYIDDQSDVDLGGLTPISSVLTQYMGPDYKLDRNVSYENPLFVSVQDKE